MTLRATAASPLQMQRPAATLHFESQRQARVSRMRLQEGRDAEDVGPPVVPLPSSCPLGLGWQLRGQPGPPRVLTAGGLDDLRTPKNLTHLQHCLPQRTCGQKGLKSRARMDSLALHRHCRATSGQKRFAFVDSNWQ